MATASTIAVNIVARTGNYTRGTAIAGTSTTMLQSKVGGLRSALLTVAPAAIAASGALFLLARSGEQIARAMAQSTAIMSGLTDELRNRLMQAALDVGAQTKYSTAAVAKGYFYLASAGYDAAQSIVALPKVASFAQAGMFDLALATDFATDAQSALGLTAKDPIENLRNLSRVTDVLVGSNTLANATVQQFSEGLTNKLGPALRRYNKTIEEGTAILTIFADQGLKGAEAGTAAAIVLRELASKSIENAAAWEKLKVAVYDDGKLRATWDIIRDLTSALQGMSDKEKILTFTALGLTRRGLDYTSSLLGTADAMEKNHDAYAKMGGITEQVAKDNLTPLQDLLRRLTNMWDIMSVSVSKVTNAIAAFLIKLSPTTAGMLAFAGSFVTLMLIIPPVIRGIILVVQAIRAMGVASAIAQALSGPAGIASALIGVAAAAGIGYVAYKAFDAASSGLAESAREAANAAGKAAKEIKGEGEMADSSRKFLDGLTKKEDERAKALKKQMFDRGTAIAKQFRSPAEIYADKIRELNSLVGIGAVGWKTYGRAAATAREELADAIKAKREDIEPSRGVGAVKRGTIAGFSAVQSAKRTADDTRRRDDRRDKLIRETTRAVREAGGGSAPAVVLRVASI